MAYTYFPGCSLEAVGKPYDLSLRACFRRLDVGLTELEDWNCCGATAFMSVSEVSALALVARNLALAERQGPGQELIAPCAACYLVLMKSRLLLNSQPELRAAVDEAMADASVHYHGGVPVRHPVDILVNEIGLERIAAKAVRPLTGARVAAYYGCQVVRPYPGRENGEIPTDLDRLFRRLGAEPVDWDMKAHCCGGMLMTTAEPVAQQLSADILAGAEDAGANVIATTCPLCQLNLELKRPALSRKAGRRLGIPVVYFTQLLGLALGAGEAEVGLTLNLTSLRGVLADARQMARAHA